MSCPIGTEEQMELLQAYCAGERQTPESTALGKHLETCAVCRELVAQQQAVWSALEEWTPPAASVDFNRRLFVRIEQEVSLWDRVMQPFRPLWVRLTVPLAAAACVALMVGVVIDHHQVPPQPAPVEVAQPEQIEHALDDMQMLQDFNTEVRADRPNAKL